MSDHLKSLLAMASPAKPSTSARVSTSTEPQSSADTTPAASAIPDSAHTLHLPNMTEELITTPITVSDVTIELPSGQDGAVCRAVQQTSIASLPLSTTSTTQRLLACNDSFIAYSIFGKAGGVIRVFERDTSSRVLLKGFTGRIEDVVFFDRFGGLAAVDETGHLIIYSLRFDPATTTITVQHLLSGRFPQQGSAHRLNMSGQGGLRASNGHDLVTVTLSQTQGSPTIADEVPSLTTCVGVATVLTEPHTLLDTNSEDGFVGLADGTILILGRSKQWKPTHTASPVQTVSVSSSAVLVTYADGTLQLKSQLDGRVLQQLLFTTATNPVMLRLASHTHVVTAHAQGSLLLLALHVVGTSDGPRLAAVSQMATGALLDVQLDGMHQDDTQLHLKAVMATDNLVSSVTMTLPKLSLDDVALQLMQPSDPSSAESSVPQQPHPAVANLPPINLDPVPPRKSRTSSEADTVSMTASLLADSEASIDVDSLLPALTKPAGDQAPPSDNHAMDASLMDVEEDTVTEPATSASDLLEMMQSAQPVDSQASTQPIATDPNASLKSMLARLKASNNGSDPSSPATLLQPEPASIPSASQLEQQLRQHSPAPAAAMPVSQSAVHQPEPQASAALSHLLASAVNAAAQSPSSSTDSDLRKLVAQQTAMLGQLQASMQQQQQDLSVLSLRVAGFEDRVVSRLEQSLTKHVEVVRQESQQARQSYAAVVNEQIRRLIQSMQSKSGNKEDKVVHAKLGALTNQVKALAKNVQDTRTSLQTSVEQVTQGLASSDAATALANAIKRPLKDSMMATVKQEVAAAAAPAIEALFQKVGEVTTQGFSAMVTDVQTQVANQWSDDGVQLRALTRAVEDVLSTQLQAEQERLSGLVTQLQRQVTTLSNGSPPARAPAVQAPPAQPTVLQRCLKMASEGQYNNCFKKALSAQNLDMLLELCRNVNPAVAIRTAPGLEPMVLLSLIQQLAVGLSKGPVMAVRYLSDAVVTLDTNAVGSKANVVLGGVHAMLSKHLANPQFKMQLADEGVTKAQFVLQTIEYKIPPPTAQRQ
eukprot:m.135911 g.135911  ORF g.135911 m.135911 type:complete len:1047 (+) comp16011_c0_seq1:74-3214(+)